MYGGRDPVIGRARREIETFASMARQEQPGEVGVRAGAGKTAIRLARSIWAVTRPARQAPGGTQHQRQWPAPNIAASFEERAVAEVVSTGDG